MVDTPRNHIAEQIERIGVFCNELSRNEYSSLSGDEKELQQWGLDLLNDAMRRVNDLKSSKADNEQLKLNALVLMGDFIYSTSLLARYLPHFPFSEIEAYRQKQSAAGKKSAETKKQLADDGWGAVALKLARMSRIADEGASQEDVANYILEHWRTYTNINCVKFRTLKTSISNWEKTGKLPKRKRG